ncbi:ABC transporter permease [Bacteroidota bacterium]
MHKIMLIIRREYLSRVKKRSFIIMTFLGPILMATVFILPIILSQMSEDANKNVLVLDETGLFYGKFQDADNVSYEYVVNDLESAKGNMKSQGDYALLYIPRTHLALPAAAILYSSKQPSLTIKSYIRGVMKKEVEAKKLQASGIDPDLIKSTQTSIKIDTIRIDDKGEEEESFTEVSMGLGIFASILIYMFIFIFGAQVMRGVIEEKTNRIVEIIVSSVKPFQLMMGKILGIALVGLTQFVLWTILTFAIVSVFTLAYSSDKPKENIEHIISDQSQNIFESPNKITEEEVQIEESKSTQIFEIIDSINFTVMIFSFIFYFLGGYLLYAALFAAVGSAIDTESDTQQFMMPITIPLILSIIIAQVIVQNPDSSMAFWFSIIPLTSPVVMMVRIPFGVPLFDLYLSMGLLILGFLGTTWLAAKIYRTGILMYGKKVTYRELWKWIRYKT